VLVFEGHATIETVKIRKKAKKSRDPHKSPAAPQILPNRARDLHRPKIDALCAKVAAFQLVDDPMEHEPAAIDDHADPGRQGGNKRF